MHLEMHITKRNAYIAKQAKQFLLGLLYIHKPYSVPADLMYLPIYVGSFLTQIIVEHHTG